LDELAATIKARWVCEQAHQQLKEELGLDHFEGRSWTGLHRHALMTMIARAAPAARASREAGKKAAQPWPVHRRNPPCRRFGACWWSGSGGSWPAAPIAAPTSHRRYPVKCPGSANNHQPSLLAVAN